MASAIATPLSLQIKALAESESTALPVRSLDRFIEMGLTNEEVAQLIPRQNPSPVGDLASNETAQVKKVAQLLADCLSVYGLDGAVRWLRQPLKRFGHRSPLDFLAATQNFSELEGYLIEASEGYFL